MTQNENLFDGMEFHIFSAFVFSHTPSSLPSLLCRCPPSAAPLQLKKLFPLHLLRHCIHDNSNTAVESLVRDLWEMQKP